jgi:hypothetical protein
VPVKSECMRCAHTTDRYEDTIKSHKNYNYKTKGEDEVHNAQRPTRCCDALAKVRGNCSAQHEGVVRLIFEPREDARDGMVPCVLQYRWNETRRIPRVVVGMVKDRVTGGNFPETL